MAWKTQATKWLCKPWMDYTLSRKTNRALMQTILSASNGQIMYFIRILVRNT